MIGRKIVNGVEGGSVSVDDRGLQYGDGLFETMAASNGRVRRFPAHGTPGRRLSPARMPAPPVELIEQDCHRAAGRLRRGRRQADADSRPRSARLRAAGGAEPHAHRRLDGAAGVGGGGRAAAGTPAPVRDPPRTQSATRRNEAPQPPRAGAGRCRVARHAVRRGPDALDRRPHRLRHGGKRFPVRKGKPADATDQRLRRGRRHARGRAARGVDQLGIHAEVGDCTVDDLLLAPTSAS